MKMKFVGSDYYEVNKTLLRAVGLWPYQSANQRLARLAVGITLLISAIFVQCAALGTMELSVDEILCIISWTASTMSYIMKCIVIARNSKDMRLIVERIENHWNTLKDEAEIKIMRTYGALGRRITISCAVFVYVSCAGFVLLEFFPNILDILLPLNASRTHQLPVAVEYFVDQEEYFGLIMLHISISLLFGMTMTLATETCLMLWLQHSYGMFHVVCYRIKTSLDTERLKTVISPDVLAYNDLAEAAKSHKGIIEFTSHLSSTFIYSYLFLLPFGVLSLSLNLYQVSRIKSLKELKIQAPVALFTLGQVGYIFFCNYMGQSIMDHSIMIFDRAYESDWYAAPVPAQKVLLFILQRSLKKQIIVVCGLFMPSLEGFVTLINTAVSYYMVIRSAR